MKKFFVLFLISTILISCGASKDEPSSNASRGRLSGKFSVAPGRQVYFSQGNLQYQASTNTWRFAEHQYDIIGEMNKWVSKSYSGWIDNFAWGSSGYNDIVPYPVPNPYYVGEYMFPNFTGFSLTGENAQYDWGVHNRISNGGNKAGLWRTLTKDEWNYLFNLRMGAKRLCFFTQLFGVYGVILLPDDWASVTYYSENIVDLTLSEWQMFEGAGAAFIPCAGNTSYYMTSYGYATTSYATKAGFYWTSSSDNWNGNGCYMYFYPYSSSNINFNTGSNRLSVRLVQDVK